ncbi:MAG TPA: DUF177 domain-containing protein [Anaerolineae bacterium]|nr:DUF177 domain-containing protein [Anaerolineae bacterium]
MSQSSALRFNFGHLLHSPYGTQRIIELDYPTIRLDPETILTPLVGSFKASRTSRGIYIEGELQSGTTTECSRCLDPVNVDLTLEMNDLFYYPPPAPDGEFGIGDDGFLNLAPLVRELRELSIPIQLFCQPDCQGLCIECGQNLNEGTCDCEPDNIDPRLAILKTLLKDNN